MTIAVREKRSEDGVRMELVLGALTAGRLAARIGAAATLVLGA
ncbi:MULTISPECIES: hypothetical protein [Amycolatopsis]|nr:MULTISPECIES: hypothetical protein [Amycolatopsis]